MLLSISGDNHMAFLLICSKMRNYITFSNIGIFLCSWNKPHLVMAHYCFSMLLDSVYSYFM